MAKKKESSHLFLSPQKVKIIAFNYKVNEDKMMMTY